MSANENKQPGEGFQALLGELDTLNKAIPAAEVADDKKIQTAAADGDADDKKKEGDDKPMTKSLQVTLADGTILEAEDGTELVKSLFARVDSNEDMIVKALGGTLNLIKAHSDQLKATNELVKSLQADVAKLANQPAGRKTLVNVHEQVTAMTKANPEPAVQTVADFMVKANSAFTAGKITGIELTSADVAIRNGFAPDESVVAKVLA